MKSTQGRACCLNGGLNEVPCLSCLAGWTPLLTGFDHYSLDAFHNTPWHNLLQGTAVFSFQQLPIHIRHWVIDLTQTPLNQFYFRAQHRLPRPLGLASCLGCP